MQINREFRKIPSLKFLYEVSEDGRIFRNVKSKKQLKIIVDSKSGDCFTIIHRGKKYLRVSIARVVAECWLGEKSEGYEMEHIDRNSLNNHYSNLRYVNSETAYRMKPLALVKADARFDFESQSAAARWLADILNKTAENIRTKFKQRRSHVYGYDVIYLNVETACIRSTEQGTVHSLYLTGDLKRWNDAKQAEERDRVKHNIFE